MSAASGSSSNHSMHTTAVSATVMVVNHLHEKPNHTTTNQDVVSTEQGNVHHKVPRNQWEGGMLQDTEKEIDDKENIDSNDEPLSTKQPGVEVRKSPLQLRGKQLRHLTVLQRTRMRQNTEESGEGSTGEEEHQRKKKKGPEFSDTESSSVQYSPQSQQSQISFETGSAADLKQQFLFQYESGKDMSDYTSDEEDDDTAQDHGMFQSGKHFSVLHKSGKQIPPKIGKHPLMIHGCDQVSTRNLMHWKDIGYKLSVADLWTRGNACTDIHCAINLLSDKYIITKNKTVIGDNYKSVKDILFRYMCDYGIFVLYNGDSISAVAVVDTFHEIVMETDHNNTQHAMVVLLHTQVNKFLYTLLHMIIKNRVQGVTHIYFSTLHHPKQPLLNYKKNVKEKVREHHDLMKSLKCVDDEDSMLVKSYVYEPRSPSGKVHLLDHHRLVGASINTVESKLVQHINKEKSNISSLELRHEYFNGNTIDESIIGFKDSGKVTMPYVVPKNSRFGKSNIDIFGSRLGCVRDYDAGFKKMQEEGRNDEGHYNPRTLQHARGGLSGSTDGCVWVSVMTMIKQFDPQTSNAMQQMFDNDPSPFRHMWIMRSRIRDELTFDQHIRKNFGYYLIKRDEHYLFSHLTRGMFLCLLMETNGRSVHTVSVLKVGNDFKLYDFEDQYIFDETKGLANFHGFTNSKACMGLRIVAELCPPKKKKRLYHHL